MNNTKIATIEKFFLKNFSKNFNKLKKIKVEKNKIKIPVVCLICPPSLLPNAYK